MLLMYCLGLLYVCAARGKVIGGVYLSVQNNFEFIVQSTSPVIVDSLSFGLH